MSSTGQGTARSYAATGSACLRRGAMRRVQCPSSRKQRVGEARAQARAPAVAAHDDRPLLRPGRLPGSRQAGHVDALEPLLPDPLVGERAVHLRMRGCPDHAPAMRNPFARFGGRPVSRRQRLPCLK